MWAMLDFFQAAWDRETTLVLAFLLGMLASQVGHTAVAMFNARRSVRAGGVPNVPVPVTGGPQELLIVKFTSIASVLPHT